MLLNQPLNMVTHQKMSSITQEIKMTLKVNSFGLVEENLNFTHKTYFILNKSTFIKEEVYLL